MNPGKIAVIVPCYRVSGTIEEVISILPNMIDHIIVIDDACPDNSGRFVEGLGYDKVDVIYHKRNQGVGGAVMTGYLKAMELGCDIVVKMDGDGQMDPAYLCDLIEPLKKNEADYTKGNRFVDFKMLRTMPKVRLLGNNILSFFEKVFSGYWHIMDPTNGYTAIHRNILEKLDLSKIARGYFFESHMLLHLNLINAVVKDVPIPARYGTENSSLNICKTLISFPPRLILGLFKRIFLKYFIYDFNMASVYLVLGIPLFLWGIGFGLYHWLDSAFSGNPKTAGTIMVAALPLILSVEMLLQAVNIDIQNTPRRTKRKNVYD
ncbi:MAG: glycosyltransferase family 2 protein [Planctomycetes bacterium]|nr:glycosyltransferase family 2 protein [Planctomycetota bacterium]